MTDQTVLKINSIKAQNFLFWKDLSLDLQPGVTVVKGLNGSGKTLMWQALDHGLGLEDGKKGSTVNQLPTGATVGLNLTTGNDTTEIQLNQSRIVVRKNGKDLGLRGKTAPREHLNTLFNIPRSLYQSTIHLSGTSEHPLTTGTASSRLTWLGDVFGINRSYDVLLRKVERHYRKHKDSQVLLKDTSEQLASIVDPLEPMVTADLKKEWDEALGRMREVDEEIERRERVKDIASKLTLRYDVEELTRLLGVTKKAIKRYRSLQTDHHTYASAAKSHRKIEATLLEIDARLKELKPIANTEDTVKALRKRESKLMVEYNTLKPTAEQWEEQSESRDQLKDLKVPEASAKSVRKQLASISNSLSDREEELEALEAVDHKAHKGGACPTCATRLNYKAFQTIIDRTREGVKTLSKQEKRLKAALVYWDLKAEVTVLKDPIPAIKALAKKIKALRAVIDAKEEAAMLYERKQELKRSMTDLPAKPAPVVDDVGNPVKDLDKKLEELDEQQDVITRDIEYRAMMDAVYKGEKTNRFPRYKMKQLQILKGQLRLLADEHEAMYLENIKVEAIYNEVSEKKRKLMKRVKELKSSARKAEYLAHLREYAGPRGGRVTAIKDIVNTFVNELNRYAPTIWASPYVFDAEVDSNGFTLFVTRSGTRSDMSVTSGGETKCWRGLCALVLLQMLPASMRTDTIILDELEANLDPDARYRFCRTFIPELQKIVPKVIVVTPMGDKEIPLVADHSYHVVMERNVSRLINDRVGMQEAA